VATYPEGADRGCPILHVDMDAFYASVAVRADPTLRGKAVAVGGGGMRGVVLSATYEARRHGVGSAMPVARARALCPGLIVVPAEHGVYGGVSAQVMAILRDVTPLVEPLSLDEAFLDVAGARRLLGTPLAIAAAIRARIAGELGLPASVGIAPTKSLAKLASRAAKPDGVFVVPADGVEAFLRPLPVEALWGVGPTTARALAKLGVHRVGDLADTPADTLRRTVGVAAGEHLMAMATGRDPRRVVPDVAGRSAGAERTFETDLTDPGQLRAELLDLSVRCAARLRSAGMAARTVSIKVRTADFTTWTRSRTPEQPTDVARELHEHACALLDALREQRPLGGVRLLGVRGERLCTAVDGPVQQLLTDSGAAADQPGWREAERAAEEVSRRLGGLPIGPATLLRRADRPIPPAPGGTGHRALH
jgi:DNA polymerase-4